MIGKIETTQDINSEKERLSAEAEMHKQQLKQSLDNLKDEVKVTKLARTAIQSPVTPDVIKYGVGIGSFVLINTILPKGTSWVIRLVAPFFANRYLNKYIDQNYPMWSDKLLHAIDKKETEQKLNQSSASGSTAPLL